MEWLNNLLIEPSALQAVVVISLISAIGLGLGRIHVAGVSLGVTFVFFMGILAGHFGLRVDGNVLSYAQTFGLVLFVYALGLQVGPGFFSTFKSGGLILNSYALAVVFLGTAMAIAATYLFDVSLSNSIGVLCGAVTNTPALGAAQQTLVQLGMDSSTPALGCAVAYPLGVVGVIFSIMILNTVFSRSLISEKEKEQRKADVYVTSFIVNNSKVIHKKVVDIAGLTSFKFVISRIWREGHVSIPTSNTIIEDRDRLLVVMSEKDVPMLTELFGEHEEIDWNKEDIDWNAVDSELVSQRIVITRPEINGKKLGSLRLRNTYGINVSRVYRAGVEILPTPDLHLQLGDRLTVVGEVAALKNVEKVLGNLVNSLKEPNLVVIFIGIVLGLALGSIPLSIPGISMPVKLGLAGGPIIVGILLGTFGPRINMITYTTRSANLMLRALGLSMYLACLGIEAGAHFFETVFRPEGALWIGMGALFTIVPTIIIGVLAYKVSKIDFSSVCGMLCGSMANPMALTYANENIPGDKSSVAYASVYPLSMFVRVILVQVILLMLL